MAKRLNFLTGTWIEDAKSAKRKAPEVQVGREVDTYLRSLGGYVRQITSTGTMRNGRWHTSGQGVGISDRLCWLPGGRMIAVELKASGKRRSVTEAQLLFLERIVGLGSIGCVADSVACVERALAQSQAELLEELQELKPRQKVNLAPLFP